MDSLNETHHQHRQHLQKTPNKQDFRQYLKLVNNCDESDPLISETPLGVSLSGIQLARVPNQRLAKLNQALNAETLLPTESGLPRDFRGLSELMGFSSIELESRFKRSHNPAKNLIEAFVERQHFERRQSPEANLEEATLNDLLKFLETLQRFDIIDDFLPDLIELVEEEQQQQQLQQQWPRAQTATELSGNTAARSLEPIRVDQYDAFVCYAPEDEEHARELIYLLEQHNKRIFTTDNLLPGQLEFDALVQVISAQCRKVLILLTPNFVKSRQCEFQSKFATEIDIKSGWSAKIIPIKCEPVDDALLPPLIRVLSKIDLTSRRLQNREWQLKRLLDSLDLVPITPALQFEMADGGPQANQRKQQHQAIRRNNNHDEHADSSQQFGANLSQPIVDLAYSQSSDSAMNLSTQWSLVSSDREERSGSRSPTVCPSPIPSRAFDSGSLSPSPQIGGDAARTPLNQLEPWYKKFWDRSFKRSFKLSRNSHCSGSISPSTSSRAQLVVQETGEEKQAI